MTIHKTQIIKLSLWIGGFLTLCLTSLLMFVGMVYWGFFGRIYSINEIREFENQYASSVISSDGKVLGSIFNTVRSEADFDELPREAIEALLATEDIRFFDHDGVDNRSLLRVLIKTVILGDRSAGGGSTITQQLAKNMYGRENHGIFSLPVNKLKEIILARRLESLFSKKEILTRYLNTVSFGENTFGIEAAGKRFFNKKLPDLSAQESAILIGMLKATTSYNPRLHPEKSRDRRNVVLSQMEKYGYLEEEESDSIQKLPVELDYVRQQDAGIANYFIEEVKAQAESILSGLTKENGESWSLQRDGLVIETTLNHQLQSMARLSMHSHLATMQKYLNKQYSRGYYKGKIDSIIQKREVGYINDTTTKMRNIFYWDEKENEPLTLADSARHALLQLHAGVIGMHPGTGEVMVYVGGIDFASNPFNQVKARRQLASTFKPVLYATALENGKEPCDYIDNNPFQLTDFEDWKPTNYDEESGGKYSLAGALASSKNIPSVRLLFETGFEKVANTWQNLGFSSEIESNPSLALGAIEASLWELASGYAAFANEGRKPELHMISSIKTSSGEVLYKHETKETVRVLEAETTHKLAAILQKALNEGTGTSIRSRFGVNVPLAAKTGTSQNYADAWFIAYNPGILLATRVGNSMPSIHFNDGRYGAGSTLALPIIGQLLSKAQSSSDTKNLVATRFTSGAAIDRWVDCPDYLDNTGFEKFINIFKNEETTLEKEQKRAKRKGFFKRLFGDKKEADADGS